MSTAGGNENAQSADARPPSPANTSPPANTAAPASLIDMVVDATEERSAAELGTLDAFLANASFEQSLALWASQLGLSGDQLTVPRLARLINRDIARIDDLLTRQVNAILHQPRFQKLEASWRGLRHLVDQVDDDANVKIRLLNVSWKTLVRDLDRSIEFDQSQLFRKIYSEEFDTSGGEPFSVLLGDYDIRHRPDGTNPMDDIQALGEISQVAAAAFAPFIASANPGMFGLDSFAQFHHSAQTTAAFQQPEYLKWQRLRESEDARFVGLTLPHTLMRTPYTDHPDRTDGFRFQEDVSGAELSGYLWGNSVYAFGGVLIRAFSETGWLADIRGVRRGEEGGGIVADLPVHSFGTDRTGVATKASVETAFTDTCEKELGNLGFIPLCSCKDTVHSAFYSTSSIQKPKQYDEPTATANARLSAMLPYILCVSRVAHCVKVMGRDMVGSYAEASDCETRLNDWIQQYVTEDDDATAEVKARFPLRDAAVHIREQPGKPGSYSCTMHLQPHYQLDGMSTNMKLATELVPAKRT